MLVLALRRCTTYGLGIGNLVTMYYSLQPVQWTLSILYPVLNNFIDTVEPGYNEQEAPLSLCWYLEIIYMNMESAPNRYWSDSLLYQSAPHSYMS